MFIKSKLSFSGLTFAALFALTACASQAPRISNPALGFAVKNYNVVADGDEQAFSSALGSALSGIGVVTAMPAKADVTIDLVRYDSPVIGFFYGGQHYASLSVVLTENSGTRINSFPLYVAANGNRITADADLAAKAAEIIAAKAANAFMPIKALTNAKSATTALVINADPIVEVSTPTSNDFSPCVIGPDGKCLVF